MFEPEQFERALAQCRRERLWEEAYVLIDRHLSETGENMGIVKAQAALTRYTESLLHARSCLLLTDQAIALLTDNQLQTAKTLINGLKIARHGVDATKAKEYSGRLWVLLDEVQPVTEPWVGRILTTLGLYYAEIGEAKAASYLCRSVKWHLAHVGPYSEHDRVCQIGLAGGGLCELYIGRGDLAEAEKLFQTIALRLEVAGRTDVLAYLRGLLAVGRKETERAATWLNEAIALAEANRDHEFVLKVTERLADLYAAAGERVRVAELLQPLINKLAYGGPVAVLIRLQRKIRRFGKEGDTHAESDHCVGCGTAGNTPDGLHSAPGRRVFGADQ